MPTDPQRSLILQILWLLTHRKRFCREFAARLRPEFFGAKSENYLADIALRYYRRNKLVLKPVALEHRLEADDNSGKLEQLGLEPEVVRRLYDRLVAVPKGQEEHIWQATEDFIKHQTLSLALRQAANSMNEGELDEAWEIIDRARSQSNITKPTHVSFNDNADEVFRRIRDRSLESAHIPTGIRRLDAYMQGGLLPSELAVYISATGMGKTMFLCQVASRSVGFGVPVAYYTLEVDRDQIFMRAMANASGVSIDDLETYAIGDFDHEDEETREYFKSIPDYIDAFHRRRLSVGNANLVIRDITERHANLDTIVADLDFLEESQDFVPELVIIDYADRLRPRNQNQKRYEGQEEIYQDLQALAKERNIAIWTASQVNREGLKKERLTLDNIQGAFAKTFEASFVIAAGQNSNEEISAMRENHFLYFFMAKTRRGDNKGKMFYVHYDFSRSRFEAIEDSRRIEPDELSGLIAALPEGQYRNELEEILREGNEY